MCIFLSAVNNVEDKIKGMRSERMIILLNRLSLDEVIARW
jgi:hypothetical protein